MKHKPKRKLEVTTLDLALLTDPEFITRVKRRAGPSLWGAVATVLAAASWAAQVPIEEPDPMAPKPQPKKRVRTGS